MDRLISSVELKPAIVLMTKNGYFWGGAVQCGMWDLSSPTRG